MPAYFEHNRHLIESRIIGGYCGNNFVRILRLVSFPDYTQTTCSNRASYSLKFIEGLYQVVTDVSVSVCIYGVCV